MTFARRRNRLTTHSSESIPVVKRRMTVLRLSPVYIVPPMHHVCTAYNRRTSGRTAGTVKTKPLFLNSGERALDRKYSRLFVLQKVNHGRQVSFSYNVADVHVCQHSAIIYTTHPHRGNCEMKLTWCFVQTDKHLSVNSLSTYPFLMLTSAEAVDIS